MPSLMLWRSAPQAETTLYAELIRRGLPADYARRAAEEIDDHRADVLAEAPRDEAAAARRVGDVRSLAARIAGAYRRRSWFGRWPLVTSLLLAPFAFFAGWIAVVYVVAVGVCLADYLGSTTSSFEDGIWRDSALAWRLWFGCAAFSSFLLPAGFMWLSGRVLLRRAQSRIALIIACCSIAAVNTAVCHTTYPCPDDPGLACNGVELFLGPITRSGRVPWASLITHGSHGAVVLATGALVLSFESRRRRAALLAPAGASMAGRLAA